ncbi:MAG: hypothetical protein AABZ64_02015 [Nitrospinota bacterium]
MTEENNKSQGMGKGTLVLRKAAAIVKDIFAHPMVTSTITITATKTEIRPHSKNSKASK